MQDTFIAGEKLVKWLIFMVDVPAISRIRSLSRHTDRWLKMPRTKCPGKVPERRGENGKMALQPDRGLLRSQGVTLVISRTRAASEEEATSACQSLLEIYLDPFNRFKGICWIFSLSYL